jgi:hypothetical protein
MDLFKKQELHILHIVDLKKQQLHILDLKISFYIRQGTYVKQEERAKFPSGIPKGKMRPAQPGDKFALLGPDGFVVPIID